MPGFNLALLRRLDREAGADQRRTPMWGIPSLCVFWDNELE